MGTHFHLELSRMKTLVNAFVVLVAKPKLSRGATVSVASISDEVREELEALRSRESTDSMAAVLKIDPDTMSVVADETCEDITLYELAEELPEHQPRYIVYPMGY